MDKYQRDAITKARPYLVKHLTLANILDNLTSENIFTDTMVEYIMAERTRSDQIRRLLSDLVRRPFEAYDKFLKVLRDCGEHHCADKIREMEVLILQEQQQRNPNTAINVSSRSHPIPGSGDFGHQTSGNSSLSQPYPQSSTNVYPSVSAAVNVAPSAPEMSRSYQETGSWENSEFAPGSSMETSLIYSRSVPAVHSSPVTSSPVTSSPVTSSPVTSSPVTSSSVTSSPVTSSPVEINQPDAQPTLRSPIADEDVEMVDSTRTQFSQQVVDDDHLDLMSNDDLPALSVRPSVYQRNLTKRPHEIYKHDSEPYRGCAVVINNKTFFSDSLSDRDGSDTDVRRLLEMLRLLGFVYESYTDLLASEMQEVIEKFSQHPDLEKVDSCILVIMSHGDDKGNLYGIDGLTGDDTVGYVTDRKIKDCLSNSRCKYLRGKPKLIILQACRGSDEDYSIESPQSSIVTPDQRQTRRKEVVNDATVETYNPGPLASQKSLPAMADFLTVYSTTKGYVAYRHVEDGSPFIQALTEVLLTSADKEQVQDMMTKVNRKLAEFMTPDGKLTISDTGNQLTRRWYLNPPNLAR